MSELKAYRKKPIVIQAYQTDEVVEIKTLEGTMTANIGDWVITGVKGEQYPCKPDIFEATYEPADKPDALSATIKEQGELMKKLADALDYLAAEKEITSREALMALYEYSKWKGRQK